MGRIFKLGIGIVAALFTIAAQAATDLGGYTAPGKDTRPVTILRGDFSPANSAMTITRSGVYRLTGNMTGSGTGDLITITASDVELNLDGSTLTNAARGIVVSGDRVTITNGSIDTMGTAGLVVSGSTCVVEDLEITNATKGIILSSSVQNSFKNCRVSNATSMGIELVSSSTNSFVGCDILDMASTTVDMYGIYVHGGSTANTFEKCSVKGLMAGDFLAQGIVFEDADQSYITGCAVIDVVSTGSMARGINLDDSCFYCSLIGNTVKFLSAPAGTVATDAIGIKAKTSYVNASLNVVSQNYLADNVSGPTNYGQGAGLLAGLNYSTGVNTSLIKSETDPFKAGFNVSLMSPSTVAQATLVDPLVQDIESTRSIVEVVSADFDASSFTTGSKLDVLNDVMVTQFGVVNANLDEIDTALQLLTASELDHFVSTFEQLIGVSGDLLSTMTQLQEVAADVEATLTDLDTLLANVAQLSVDVQGLEIDLDVHNVLINSKLDVIDTEVGVVNSKVDTIDTEVGVINGKVDVIDGVVDTIAAGLIALDAQVVTIDTEVGDLTTAVGTIDTEVGVIDTKIGQLGTSIGDVLADTLAIESKIDVIDTEVGALTTAVGTIDTEVGALTTAVGTIDTEVGVIDTKIGQLGTSIGDVLADTLAIESKIDVIDTEVGALTTAVGTIDTEVGVIDTKIGQLGTSIGDVLADTLAIESKIDVIDTEVGALTTAVGTIDTEVGVIDTKIGQLGTSIGDVLADTLAIESKIDVIDTEVGALTTAVGTIDTEIGVIDTKIGQLGTSIGDVLADTLAIESKVDVIDTEVGALTTAVGTIDTELGVVNANLTIVDGIVDTIAAGVVTLDSKIDELIAGVGCDATGLAQADVVGGALTLSTAGNYCLSENITSTIYITADNVSLCLNDRELTGCINVTGKDALVKNGRIAVPSSLDSTNAISLVAGADTAVISNVIAVVDSGAGARGSALSIAANDAVIENSIFKGGVSSASSGGNGVSCSACTRVTLRSSLCSGGSGTSSDGAGVSVVSGASLVTITNCTLESNEGNGATIGGSAIDVLDSMITASTLNASYCVSCVSPAARVHLLNCRLDGKDAQLQSGTGDGINVASGCSGVEVRDCTIFGCADKAIEDSHNATVANYSSIIYNNFAYDIAGATKYQVRNRGSMGESYGVDLVSGTPGIYSNVYIP